MIREIARLVCLFGAFWTALALYRGERPMRLVAALAGGAALTHVGWVALYWSVARTQPNVIFDLESGHSILFLPLAFLPLARNAAAWRVLPGAVAVARVGCLAAGCCGGVVAPWGTHPTMLYEIAWFVGLHVGLRRLPDGWVGPIFVVGFGLVRLATNSLRAVQSLGPPMVSPPDLAALWVLGGIIWAVPKLGFPMGRGRSEVVR